MCHPGIADIIKCELSGPLPERDKNARRPVLLPRGGIVDLTHELHENFPTLLGEKQFARTSRLTYARAGINLSHLTISEHVGTHIDAPLHFSAYGQAVNEIPPEELVVPLCVIDIKEEASSNPNVQLTVSDIKRWISSYGDIPDGACIAMNSGWDAYVDGEKFRNAGANGKLNFPGIHEDAALYLLSETTAAGIAVDTLSLDYGPSTSYPTHRVWLGHGRWGLECVANLDRVPAFGATLVVGAPKHRSGSGGQTRLFAFL